MVSKYKRFFSILAVLGVLPFSVAGQTNGEQLYLQNCLVCHADDGSGAMPGVTDLAENQNWSTMPVEMLIARIKEGIALPGTTVTMPPNGGNPDLTDSDLKLIVNYMRAEFTQQ